MNEMLEPLNINLPLSKLIRLSLEDLPDFDTKAEPFLISFTAWIVREEISDEQVELMADYLRSRSLDYLKQRFDYCAVMKMAWRKGWIFEPETEAKGTRY